MPSPSMVYGSQSLPMIPDGRMSRVRFETAARCSLSGGPSCERASSSRGLHTLAGQKFAPPESYQPGQRCYPGVTRTLLTEQVALLCPQALRSRRVTFSSGLLRPDVPVPMPLIHSAWRLVDESLPFGPPTAAHRDLPDVISAHLSPDAWTPTPAVSVVHVPVSSPRASAFPP